MVAKDETFPRVSGAELLESSNVGICIVDVDFRVVYLNRALEQFYGLKRERLVGQDKRELVRTCLKQLFADPETYARRVLTAYARNDDVEEFECRVLPAGKRKERWLLHWSRPITAGACAGGRIEHFTDISDRKAAEKELQKQQRLLREIGVNLPGIIYQFLLDPKGRKSFPYVSEGSVRVLGVPARTFRNNPEAVCELIVPGDREMYRRAAAESMRTLSNFELQFHVRDARGEERCLEAKSTPHALADGSTIWTGVAVDITELEQKASLIDSLAKFPFQNPHPVLRIARDGTVLYANPASARLLKSWHCRPGQKLPSPWQEMSREALEKNRISDAEVRYEDRTAAITFAPVAGSEYINIYGLDITERRHLEEQLQIRQRMDSVGTLAGGIAHDFNNLLAGVIGYLDILIKRESAGLTEIQRTLVGNALSSGFRAADLVKQFQSLSRGYASEKRSLDVYLMAEEVFSLLDSTTDRLIEKIIAFSPDTFYVLANPAELHQVLLNLATNAVRAIETKGIQPGDFIRLGAENLRLEANNSLNLKAGDYIHLRFADSGAGMSKEVKKQAFDPLFTTQAKSSQKGQGLGLAMVYNILTRRHGGSIDIESAPGKGSIFHLYLPQAGEPEASSPEQAFPETGRGETVLVVDDEKHVRHLAREILESQGYRVLSAENGEEALELWRNQRGEIACILLDLIMPVMSGQGFLQKILQDDPDVKVIISSGYSQEAAQLDASLRAHAYLAKPYQVGELLHTVRDIIDGRTSGALPEG
jgi:PAS domain S-box-containing protein